MYIKLYDTILNMSAETGLGRIRELGLKRVLVIAAAGGLAIWASGSPSNGPTHGVTHGKATASSSGPTKGASPRELALYDELTGKKKKFTVAFRLNDGIGWNVYDGSSDHTAFNAILEPGDTLGQPDYVIESENSGQIYDPNIKQPTAADISHLFKSK